MIIGIVVAIVVLAAIVGLLALIVGAARRRGAGGVDARSVRRFFQYVLLYALFVTAATGLSDLLGRLLGVRPEPWEDEGYLLAQALTFVIVGLPLAAGLAWWTWRRHRADTTEAGAALFTGYLTLTALTGLIVAATSLQALVAGFLQSTGPDAAAAARVVVWGALWAGHWVAARRSLDTERGTPHLLLGSFVALVLLVAGLAQTLGALLDLVLRPGVLDRPSGVFPEAVGLLVAGAASWSVYWLVTAVRLPRGTLWLGYVLPVGVGGGLVLALVAASRLLWTVLVWLVGDRLGRSASEHFDQVALDAAVLIVGVLVWRYHRSLLGPDAGARPGADAGRGEVRRVYEYLVAGIALVAAAFGVGTILVALIEAATPGWDEGMTVRNTALAAVTVLLVGLPVWWLFWRRIRVALAADPGPEVASPTRRVYLVVLFGVAGVAAVIALMAVALTFFQDLVGARLGAPTLREARYGLGVLVAAAAVSVYHGVVFRRDRAEGPTPAGPAGAARGPRSVLLVGALDPDLERLVRRATGAHVEGWGRLDAPAAPWDVDRLLAELAEHPGADVLVLADGPGLRVLPVDVGGGRPRVGDSR